MTVVFLNFSNGANPPRSERFFSRAVRVFLALYFTSTALVRDFFFFFNSFPTKLRAGTYVYGSYDRGNYVSSTVKEKVFQDVFKISADLDRRLAREVKNTSSSFSRSLFLNIRTLQLLTDPTIFLNFLSERPWQRFQILVHSWGPSILDPSAYGFGNARVSSGKLSAGVAKI